jgi:hypothetical protein
LRAVFARDSPMRTDPVQVGSIVVIAGADDGAEGSSSTGIAGCATFS